MHYIQYIPKRVEFYHNLIAVEWVARSCRWRATPFRKVPLPRQQWWREVCFVGINPLKGWMTPNAWQALPPISWRFEAFLPPNRANAISQQIQAEVIAYSYLATMIKQLLTDATVRSKTTLWTFFTGFFGIAVDEMMHQSQCSTCEAWSLKSWDKGSAGEKLLFFFKSCDADFWMQQTGDIVI